MYVEHYQRNLTNQSGMLRVVIPNYSCIPESFRNEFRYVTHFYMSTGSYIQNKYVGVLQYELDGIKYYFIDNQEYFDSFLPYGNVRYDIEKFCFLIKQCYPCCR